MQPVQERGSIDNPLTFDVGLIQISFIPVCSPNTCNISVKLRRGFDEQSSCDELMEFKQIQTRAQPEESLKHNHSCIVAL